MKFGGTRNIFSKHTSLSNLPSYILFLLDYLFVAKIGVNEQRSWSHAFFLTLICSITVLSLYRPAEVAPLDGLGHTFRCFQMAINRVSCDRISHLPDREEYNLSNILKHNTTILSNRILDLPKIIAGSTANYCAHNNRPCLNNENSLTLLFETIIRLYPTVTLAQMSIIVAWIKIACLTVFVFFLFRVGLSPVFGCIAFLIGLRFFELLYSQHYSAYSFLVPFTVLFISLMGISISIRTYLKIWTNFLFMLFMGVLGIFFWNLRSDYFFIVVAVFILYLLFVFYDLRQRLNISRLHKSVLIVSAVIFFIVGVGLFKGIFLKPIYDLDYSATNYVGISYHSWAHPIVLGLSVPENSLSEREGISWSDEKGHEIAKRFDPQVDIRNNPVYEKTLFLYYLKLWLFYPSEMIDIYISKFRYTGYQVINYVNRNTLDGTMSDKVLLTAIFPMKILPHGYATLLFFFITATVGILGLLRKFNMGQSFAFGLTALSMAGALLWVESLIIYPQFYIAYGACLLFLVLFCGLLVYQVLFNFILWSVHAVMKKIIKQ